jgi:hypothetical protein
MNDLHPVLIIGHGAKEELDKSGCVIILRELILRTENKHGDEGIQSWS